MTKKILKIGLIILMVVGMCACGQKSDIEKAEDELVGIIEKEYWAEFQQRFSNLLYNDNTLEYSFKKLGKLISISTSDDKKVRIYAWIDDTGYNYNSGFQHIIQFQGSYNVYSTSYEKVADPECKEGEDWACRGFEIYTATLNERTYYIIEASYMQAAGWLGNRDIAIYTIENNDLVKKSLFNTKKEVLSEIGFEYDAASYYYDFIENDVDFKKDENSFDWLFRYDDEHKTIYVPLVDGLKVTDKYLFYQWDGKYFTYKGIK
ncbi:hypothetical protein FACS1894199_12710 [Bacteroidia bacterium]|nr:hypothetical protein FACS1894199_12710 [Bacteroidia bacterium]